MSNSWISIRNRLPQRGVVVETRIDDGKGIRNEQDLKLGEKNGLWFVPDGSMYVYYEPTHWRLKQELRRG